MKKFAILVLILLFIWAFFIEPNKLEVTQYSLKDKELSGIKIVFVSDLHVKPHQKKRLQEIISAINSQNPDIVLMGGDFVSGHIRFLTMPIEKIATELQAIKAKSGVYTVLGNHDEYLGAKEMKNALEANNITVLYNSNKKVKIKEKSVYIAGLKYLPNMREAINSLEGTKSPIIMLSHSPDEIDKIPPEVNLILSGHTHGGQVVLPLIGPLMTASMYGKKYVNGFVEENRKRIITTKGVGVSILPFRFNCAPEIVVIEFVE